MLPSWPQKNKSPLSSNRNATLHVGDINRPVFHQASWGSKWPRVALTEPPLPKSAPKILTWTQGSISYSLVANLGTLSEFELEQNAGLGQLHVVRWI